ncbi:MAG TPA: hypothetical protein VLF91_00670 [Candidatus Saccharimonadales bacterium]|nr:hypothetical protein [Candidatus Saccharimonadales bacterium]
MEYAEFASAYPYDLTADEIHRGSPAPYIADAQDWSYRWGRVAHALLGTADLDVFGGDELRAYADWYAGGMSNAYEQLDAAPVEIQAHGYNELNFHHLNRQLLSFWIPFTVGEWTSDRERQSSIIEAQDFLAFKTLDHYTSRENLIAAAEGTHILFDPEVRPMHDAITGMVQEYDAALVLLDVVRKNRHFTVVPAPLQFERTRKRTNVDFIVADFVGRRAVGVQVKSRLRTEDTQAVDPDRVVFIDGDTDLGNIKVVRTHRNRSTERVVAWPGILGVKRISQMKNYGQRGRHLWPNTRALPILKQVADRLTGSLKVDQHEITAKIGARILEKLQA